MHTRFGDCQTLASNTGWAVYAAEEHDFMATLISVGAKGAELR